MPMRQLNSEKLCCGGEHPGVEEGAPGAKTYDDGVPVPDHGGGVLWCGEGCPDMENGNAVVKPLVTRTSDGLDDDRYVCTFVKNAAPLNQPPLPQKNPRSAPGV